MKNWRLWLGVAISAFFIWFALRQIKDWDAFINAFRQVKLWVFAPALLGYFVILITRSWRWHYIMNSQMKVSFWSSMVGICVGYMANNLLPFRAGEVIRAVVVGRREKKNFSPVFATVAVERIFDSLVVLLLLAALLMTLEFPPEYKNLESLLRKGGIGALAGAMVLIIGLYLFYLYKDFFLKIGGQVLGIFGEKVKTFGLAEAEKFSHGLAILGKPVRLIVVMLLSLVVWVVNLLPVIAVGWGFGINLKPIDAALVLFVGAFSAAIPAAPGFIGTFHYFTSSALAFLGLLTTEKAMAFATVLHAFYYFPIIIIGLLLAWREGVNLKQLQEEAKEVEQ
jgi:glycosyltransferase 2 family protein